MVWLIVKGDIILANETCRAEKEVVHTFFGHTAEELRLPVYTFERHGRLPQRFAPVARGMHHHLISCYETKSARTDNSTGISTPSCRHTTATCANLVR